MASFEGCSKFEVRRFDGSTFNVPVTAFESGEFGFCLSSQFSTDTLPRTLSTQAVHLSPEAMASLPRHVAIIMDGNGRWARQRHLLRIEGHRAGAESARVIIRTAGELGIKYLTLYAFSVENWNRPKDEVDALMKYLVHYLKTETSELNKNNVRLEIIGQVYRLPELVQDHLKKTIGILSKNNGLTLVMALSYGGRTEIVDAVRSVANKAKLGELDPA